MAKKNQNLEEESNLFLHGKRPNWTPEQQVQLWVKCGGYCTMCNTSLLEHEYFGVPGKFGELAHIIAHSPKGPRPNVKDYPPEYISSPDNIMVLCPLCHTMIDKKENEHKFTEDLLREWKERHEKKIKAQTQPTFENKRKAIRFCAKIGSQMPSLSDNQIKEALFPNYFIGNEPPSEIKISISDTEKNEQYWENCAKELKAQFIGQVLPCLKAGMKLAVFGLAPIPLLVLFGHLLADYNVANIQNCFRNSDNKWAWPEEGKSSRNYFKVSRPATPIDKTTKKVLALSLTSSVRSRLEGDAAIWEVMPKNGPHYESIQTKAQLNEFGKVILALLDEISKEPGDVIHVYSAMPNSAAIMFGTKFMKKANNQLYIYDYVSSLGQDVLALKIGNL